MRPSRVPAVTFAIVMAFLYLPILFLVANSVNASQFGAEWKGFTLKWYGQLFRSGPIWDAVGRSLGIAAAASAVAMAVGTAGAWALHFSKSRLQRVHVGLVYLPLIVPDILMGISLLIFFVAIGADLGVGTITLAHITFCISYVALAVLARLQDFDRSLVDAARDLGAGRWQVLRSVIIPALAPGIIAGGLLAFTLSIDDFVITFFVAGPGSTTLPVHVYSMMRHSKQMPIINALSTLLLVLTLLSVWCSQRLATRRSSP